MAIQIPNPGTGNGATGDNEFVLWSKTKDNFSDQTNAASRLVGTADENVCLVKDASKAVHGNIDERVTTAQASSYNLNTRAVGDRLYAVNTVANSPSLGVSYIFTRTIGATSGGGLPFQISTPAFGATGLATRNSKSTSGGGGKEDPESWTPWSVYYGTHNTKLDTNGAITPSSPTIDLYSDRIETNEDGTRMNPEFIRNGVGDYTIKNTTGLRDEGWYVKIPNDINGNPKVAVTVDTDKDGNLSVKTYRRIFSLETFIFIPDLETPLDIPEGRWIDLRFNDLPYDELDDTQTEV